MKHTNHFGSVEIKRTLNVNCLMFGRVPFWRHASCPLLHLMW